MSARQAGSRGRWLPPAAVAGLALLAGSPASADEVLLRNGGRIDGVLVEETARAVVIETGPGRVSLPMAQVARIVRTRSALEAWRERAASLHPADSRGWASLARWAEDAGLGTQAKEAWQRVVAVDPGNAEANRGLGRVALDGAWLSEDEAYRARGYVQYEGRWVSPAEHEALVRERAADDAADQARRDATIRAREAEARAREAEARARAAEAGAQPADESGGIPFAYAYGGGYGPFSPMRPYVRAHSRPFDPRLQLPAVVPHTRPSSLVNPSLVSSPAPRRTPGAVRVPPAS